MSIDAGAMSTGTRPRQGRVLSLVFRFGRWAWRSGDRGSPVPILGLAASAMLLTQLLRDVHDVDIFWQLKLGEITLTDGLPSQEPFLAGKGGEPLAVVAWLSQVVYAAVRLIGGWTLLWLVDSVVWLGGFVVVAAACHRKQQNAWPVVCGLWLGWFAALPAASLRPQSFALLAFGLFLVLIRSNVSTLRTAVLGGLLCIVWQNLHPSVAVGFGVLLVSLLAETVQYWRSRRPAPPWRLVALLPPVGLAQIATPAGFDIFRIAAANADRSLYLNVAEWQPLTWQPWDFGRPMAWFSLAVTLTGLAVRGRNARAETLAAVALLSVAMVVSHRFNVFWGIAVIPLWCELLNAPSTEPAAVRWRRARNAVSDAALLLVVGGALVGGVPFGSHYPFAGVAALRASGREGTIYSTYYWGGVLTDAGHPRWAVTHDGRYYLFTRAEWDETFATARGERDVDAVVAAYRPAAFFLLPGLDDGLIQQLRTNANWRQLHADANSVVYVPAAGR